MEKAPDPLEGDLAQAVAAVRRQLAKGEPCGWAGALVAEIDRLRALIAAVPHWARSSSGDYFVCDPDREFHSEAVCLAVSGACLFTPEKP